MNHIEFSGKLSLQPPASMTARRQGEEFKTIGVFDWRFARVEGLTQLFIKTVDGEEREARVWAGGDWTCPYCSAANEVKPPEYKTWPYPCANPMCIAGGKGDPESVQVVREAREREARERERRDVLRARDEAAREELETRRRVAVGAFTDEATEQGLCVQCWWHSTDGGRYLNRAVKIRHRKPENCPRAKRRQR